MHKVNHSTHTQSHATTAAHQTQASTQSSPAAAPGKKQENTSNPQSEKASKQHASQRKEQHHLESSIRKAQINNSFDKNMYANETFDDAEKLNAPPGTKPLDPPIAHRVDKGEPKEERLLERTKGKGTLVELSKGQPDRPMTVTIHGIKASPTMVDSLSKRAAKAGDAVKTFAYDDKNTSLTKSSKDLAKGLHQWMKENPGRTLRIDAHSMGGRVALGALDELMKNKESRALLKDRKVELNLIASPINGLASGYGASIPGNIPLAGPFVREFGPYVKPGMDMTPTSDFQDRLDNLKLPKNVKVRAFISDKDDVVNYGDSFDKMCKQLHAKKVYLHNSDHVSAPDDAARWLAVK
ncbi:MAG TPA: alpha/beta hydrolase [Acidobacteriota bacterium]|nr:alpha/beta hydrolase [Acidobacteriota bacterium]